MSIEAYTKKEAKYTYVETGGDKEVLFLLHGLFGALSNFEGIINKFSSSYNVVCPILPIFEIPFVKLNLGSLVSWVEEFVKYKAFKEFHVIGNSLGGHLAQLYTLKNPSHVKSLALTGSSGLFEDSMGNTFPKRGDYEFIRTKTQSTFYDPSIATKEMIDEVYDIVNDRSKTLSIIATARSAIKNNLEDKIINITCPTLLVWGKQDTITPPFVGEKFRDLIPNSSLVLVDKCGHAPMMEVPDQFNDILEAFLNRIKA